MPMPNSANQLRNAATAAHENAYAPSSNFKVGAAMQRAFGDSYMGATMGNVSSPVGTYAEEAALAAMIVAGKPEINEAYAIADAPAQVLPRGACLQRLKEFGKDDVSVWMGTTDGKEETTTIGDLLPEAFDLEYMARR